MSCIICFDFFLLNLLDVPAGHELSGFYPREEERGGHRFGRDTESLGASYDRYLRGVLCYEHLSLFQILNDYIFILNS